jgi:hypothetical protein
MRLARAQHQEASPTKVNAATFTVESRKRIKPKLAHHNGSDVE